MDAVETIVNDPLQYLAPLPYVGRYYPYGFPVEIATDACQVLQAAGQSWAGYTQRFDTPPLRVHVFVAEGGSGLPPSPVLRGQRHLLLWICDQQNFSVCDRLQRFASCYVTRSTLADSVFFRWHFLDAVVYTLLEQTCFTALHAACVALNGAGVLLQGPSGVGKSTLAYACARRGWTYISDDGTCIVWGSPQLAIGESHHFRFRAEAPELFPELQGLTAGREMDRKPTIELFTADLPIRTAPETRVEWLVFLERRPGAPTLARIGKEDAREALLFDTAAFDPEVQARRMQVFDDILELPTLRLRYSNLEEAVALLEKLVRGGTV